MDYCDILPRKRGRPKVIPKELVSFVMASYKTGAGYRSISRDLKNDGVIASPSTVRRLVKEEFSKRHKAKAQHWHNPWHHNRLSYHPKQNKEDLYIKGSRRITEEH